MKKLLIATFAIASACGDTTSTPAPDTSCIGPKLYSTNDVSGPQVTFSVSGMFTSTLNGCGSSGTYACSEPGKFHLDILSNENAAENSGCQSIGVYDCQYSYSTNVVTIWCQGDGVNNYLDPAVPFSLYW